MQKNITITCLIIKLFLFSCSVNRENKNMIRYKNQVIEQLVSEDDSVYRVQIGIMASSFWLDKQNSNFDAYLLSLQHSLTYQERLDIGVEKDTNKIIFVKKR